MSFRNTRSARLFSAAGLPIALAVAPVHAQDKDTPPAPTKAAAPAAPPPAQAPAPAKPVAIAFNFKGTPFDQVIDFVAREAGLPVIFEAKAPAASMTFVGGQTYALDEALSILNLNLAMHGVQLRKQDKFLYLASLEDSAKKPGMVVGKDLPPGITPDQILTLTIPLSNARAETVVEQIKPLLGKFGVVVPVPVQNMVVVTDTAAQCQRIREIVSAVDMVRPVDSEFRLFPLKHAQVDNVLGALRGLMSERTVTTFIQADGKQVKTQDNSTAGLNLAADPRTNSIVAVGSKARIKTVEELIALLDVPESVAADTEMMTISLSSLTSDQAAQQLTALYSNLAANRKPTIIPVPGGNRITVVGSRSLLAQASSLLAQVDPASNANTHQALGHVEARAAVVLLKHLPAPQVEQMLAKLFTKQQQQTIRTAAAPDGRSIILSGNPDDVESLRTVIQQIDSSPDLPSEVRIVKVTAGDPAQIVKTANDLYRKTGQADRDPVAVNADGQARTLVLVGTPAGVASFEKLLTTAQANTTIERVGKLVELTKTKPATIAPKLERLARVMLTPDDGSTYNAPVFEPLDDVNKLMVRATGAQFPVIEQLIAKLDTTTPSDRDLRIVKLPGSSGAELLKRTQELYNASGGDKVDAEFDAATGNAVVTGPSAALARFTGILSQIQQLVPPQRTTRLLDVQNTKAQTVLEPLKSFLASTAPTDATRKVPEPTLQIVDATNSILVTAEDTQHQLIADYVKRLDKPDISTLPPLKLLQVRAAEADKLAAMLTQQYAQRPQSERAAKPVEIRSDAATNTLIVSAHPDVFDQIKSFVDDVNKESTKGTDKVTQLFQLKTARATDIAMALDKLYPQPPVPVDRQNRPQPWLQAPKPVQVTADANTNSLIVYGPADQMPSIKELADKLDKVDFAQQAQIRTYRVLGPSLEAVARTLQNMQARGVLAAAPNAGKPPIPVIIDSEPKSGTLIVAGDDAVFATVDTVLKDLAAIPVEKGLRIVPISGAKAADVKLRAQAIYDAQIKQDPTANPIDITVDERTNTLSVVGDVPGLARFSKIMDELARQIGPARETRFIELKLAKAVDAKKFLDELVASSQSLALPGGPAPVVEVVESANALLVAATSAQMPIIDGLLKNLDAKQSVDRPPMRILKLKSTEATNLAAVLQKSFDSRPLELRTKKPADITADVATNTLVVSAHPDVLTEIEQIVTQLNEAQHTDAAGREIRIFPLRVARAEDLAQTIDQMYPQPPVPLDPRTRQPRPDLQPPREIIVRADRATNALIVDAPSKRLAGFEQLVKSLDQTKLSDAAELRTYHLAKADPANLAAAIQKIATTGGVPGAAIAPITVTSELASRTLVVSGPKESFEAIEKVIKEADGPGQSGPVVLRAYSLKNTRAGQLQPVIERLLTIKAAADAPANTTADAVRLSFAVATDTASNSLLVSASEALHVQAQTLITSLDQPNNATDVRVFRLDTGDAQSVATAISKALAGSTQGNEAPPVVAPEPTSNCVVVTGTSRQIEAASKLVQSMDQSAKPDALAVRTTVLKFARAETVRPVIESVLTQESLLDMLTPAAKAQVIAKGGIQLAPKIHVAADPRLNSIVISGPKALADLAEQVIKDLDVDPARQPGVTDRSVRVITLQNADADELAKSLDAVFKEDASAPAPTIRVDAQSNSLIVRATTAQLATIDEVVTKLDKAALASNRQMRTIGVDRSRADAELVAKTLKRLMEQGGSKVEVISTDELLKRQRATDAAKQPHSDAAPFRAAPQQPGSLRTLIATLVIAAEPPKESKPADKQDDEGITIAVDPATNSIIVVGSPKAADKAAALAQQIQRELPAEPAKVRVITLPASSDANAVAALVNQTIQSLAQAVSPAPAATLPPGKRAPALAATNPSGFTGPVSVTPDPLGGALVVVANDTDFETLAQVITSVTQLDRTDSLTVKVYHLASISAKQAEQSIRDLLSPQPTGRQARRVRQLDITVDAPAGQGQPAQQLRIDPAAVRLIPDPSGGSLILAAPADAIPLIDRFVSLIDQSPMSDRLAIRRYELRNARARDLATTLQQLFDAQHQGQPVAADAPHARFIADDRVNAILVTASTPQHEEIARLLKTADATADTPDSELAFITLQQASPATVQRVVTELLVGKDPAKRDRIRLSAEEGSQLLAVRAPKADLADIRDLIKRLDTADAAGLPVRSLKLERADATVVAQALTKFFADRAVASGPKQGPRAPRVAITGDRRSGALLVAASDDDWQTVQSLVKTFDAPTPLADMQFKVIQLKNARVADISATVGTLVDSFKWESATTGRNQQPGQGTVFVETNERTNSVIVMGKTDMIESVEHIINQLDLPDNERATLTVRAVLVEKADLRSIKTAIERAMATPGWRSWKGADPDAVSIEIDAGRRSLILVGKAERVTLAEKHIKDLDALGAKGDQKIEAVPLQFAKADRAAASLSRFFAERAKAQGLTQDPVSILGSPDGNVVVVSADDANLRILKDLLAQIDQPEQGKDRKTEVFVLQNISAVDAATALRGAFPRGGHAEETVTVTPMPSQNSLIVSAPGALYEQAETLLKQLDTAPSAEKANVATVTLSSARASDVAAALTKAMPANVKVTITPVQRTNTLLLTGSAEAINLVLEQIKKLDTDKGKSLIAFRRFKLENVASDDLSYTIRQMLRARPRNPEEQEPSVDYSRSDNTLAISAPADVMPDIEKMIQQLDVAPDHARKMDFVKLKFAKAESTARALENFFGPYARDATPAARNVTIIPDPTTDSLVVSADEIQWKAIRAILDKLDTELYDTNQQLVVIPLRFADAANVAKALNEGLRAPLEAQLSRERVRIERERQGSRRDQGNPANFFPEPTVLVDDKDIPTVSAEPTTNALVVFAGRKTLEQIQAIVKQLDVPGLAQMNDLQVIPLKSGRPSQVAETIRQLFLNQSGKPTGPRAVLVIGEDTAGALIVRADPEQFAQIKALAATLQQQIDIGRMQPYVFKLKNVPAARLAATISKTFTPTAQQMGEAVAVEVDRSTNALVVACSQRLQELIAKTVAELDVDTFGTAGNAANPNRLGQSVFIIDVTNNNPADIKKQLENMGLDKAQPADRPGVVVEPITIVPMSTRQALAVLASPGDGNAVVQLVKALDTTPAAADEVVRVVHLKKASASAIVKTLEQMLDPAKQASKAGPAVALAEHLRRLTISRTNTAKPDSQLDLAKPIRLIADEPSNAILVGSVKSNVDALEDTIELLDTLPMGESVVIRIFPLQNAQAARIKMVVDQLFKEGEALRRLAGTQRTGQPTTVTGQALSSPVATALDERTNVLIIAGSSDAVALVEVLIKDLDSDKTSNWIEPAVIAIKHADAGLIAAKLNDVLVKGLATTLEAQGLQKQYGRLRMSLAGKDPSDPKNRIEADLFAPVTGLVISADSTLNSLIVVGSTNNLAVVRELIAALDVEAAAAGNQVRVFPLQHAAADRVGRLLLDIFTQREKTGAFRPEDRLVLTPDGRTNSLFIASSARSYQIIESLLKTLDSENANYSVSLHILPLTIGDAVQLAPKIQRLMKERIEAATRQGSIPNPLDAFSVEADTINNTLIVASSEENFGVIKELVQALVSTGEATAAGQRTELVYLKKTPVTDASAQIRDTYVKKEIERRGANAVTVVANDRLNALVVTGTAKDIDAIRQLAERIDSGDVNVVRDLKRIQLKSANALEVVNLIENVLAGKTVAGNRVGTKQATRVRFLRDNLAKNIAGESAKPTEADIDGAIRDQVTVTPDLRANAVIINAPPPMVALISEIIAEIDDSKGDRIIERFQLKNADAKQMAELLKDVFTLRQQGTAYVLVPSDSPDDADPSKARPSDTKTTVTAVPDERQQLSVAIDPRTNTLIVSGTEKYIDRVRQIVSELDSIQGEERLQTVYHLRNAKAIEISKVLQESFAKESTLTRSTLGPQQVGSLQRQLEQEVTIVGDENSNKLLIASSPRYLEKIVKLIEELDSAPPQVMIQVLLAEVSLDTSDTFGADIKVGPFGTKNYSGYSLGGDSGGVISNSLGVPNLSVTSANFGLLVRALEVQGKLEVLSNPEVMVNNNKEASIQVGDSVAIASGTERTPQGGTIADVKREDIGIILKVTPSISADGFVRMDIAPEISSLTTKTTQISTDFSSPIINSRKVKTTVTVKDGQSVIIGGLIQNKDEERFSKVPLLGDIPILGIPFRTKQLTTAKTELLVVLTPRVVPGQGPDVQERIRALNEASVSKLNDQTKLREYLKQMEKETKVPALPTRPDDAGPNGPARQDPEPTP